MTETSPEQNKSPSGWGYLVPLVAAIFCFYSGCSAIVSHDAHVTHKGRQSTHLTGEKAQAYGTFQIVLGLGVLAATGVSFARRQSGESSAPPPDASSQRTLSQDASPPGAPSNESSNPPHA